MHPGFLYGPCPYTFPTDPSYDRQAPKNPTPIPPRPAFGSLKPTRPTGFPQIPCANDEGAPGHGIASRRGDGVAVGPCIQARLKAGSCGADPRGTGAGWTRQKSADAAPDRAGRMTDHAGHQPDPASRLRYAVGVPYLYLFEYLLQDVVHLFQSSLQVVVDSLQVVVRLFQSSLQDAIDFPSGCRSSL